MADQFGVFVEEDVRGIDQGGPYLYLPLTGDLVPTFDPDDQSRKAFQGQDSGLGDAEDSLVRRSSEVTFTVSAPYYPGAETGLLFKHYFGFAGTRVAEDTDAFKGILYDINNPYGLGRNLGSKAIGYYAVFDKEGSSFKRYYGGLRVTTLKISGTGTDDMMLEFTLTGPGQYVGTDAANTFTYSGPSTDPFVTADVLCYIGAGADRTGTAPDFTDVNPGTMDSFCPDSISIDFANGRADKFVFCGIEGPSKTSKASQNVITISMPIDVEDPPAGFSSYDEIIAKLTGPSSNSMMLVMDNGDLAGATTANYETTFDFGALKRNHKGPTYSSEGLAPTGTLDFTHLISVATEKPVIMQTVDKDGAY